MRRLFLGAIAVVTVACSGNDTAVPHSGTLTLDLTAAGTNDGAIVVTVSGGPVTAVQAPGELQIASNAEAAGTHIMITGAIGLGAVATIDVPDVSRANAYAVTVDQVADRTTFALLDPAPYQVTVVTK
jgi:hypothetical protein